MISPFFKGMITYLATSIKINGTQIIINAKRDWAAARSHYAVNGTPNISYQEVNIVLLDSALVTSKLSKPVTCNFDSCSIRADWMFLLPQKRKDIAMRKIKNNSRKLYNSLRKADAICMTVARYARNINREAEKTLGHKSDLQNNIGGNNKNTYLYMREILTRK